MMTDKEQGLVLLMVLWIVVMFTVIVGQFCYTMRTEVNITRNFRDEAKAYYLARAGINMALKKIIDQIPTRYTAPIPARESSTANLPWRVNMDIPAVPFGDGWFKVRLDNENGKININKANALLLQMILKPFDIPEKQKYIIVESILDWRDMDNFHRTYGAENDYYQSLPEPYRCGNRPFQDISELLLVRGVSREIYDQGLKNMVTVRFDPEKKIKTLNVQKPTDTYKININAVSVEILRCFPEITDEIVQAIIEFRREKNFISPSEFKKVVGEKVFSPMSDYITFKNSSYYTIKSSAIINESRAKAGIQALVRIDYRLKNFKIIEWLDYLN